MLKLICGTALVLMAATLILKPVSKSSHTSQPQAATAALIIDEPTNPQLDAASVDQRNAYAWKLFMYMNQQADHDVRGKPDLSKASWLEFDRGESVVWETWALASGSDPNSPSADRSEVFLASGAPVCWGDLPAPSKRTTFDLSRGFTNRRPRGAGKDRGRIDPGINALENQEVRMNRCTYETVRTGGLLQEGLYSQNLIQAAVTKATQLHQTSFVDFKPAAKEVKAGWVRLCKEPYLAGDSCEAQKARYHYRIPRPNQVWGLAAFHIMTRDLPEWFWVDFIHTDCMRGVCPCNKVKFPHEVPSAAYPASGTGKWSYYRLRGTQTAYRENNAPSALSNPELDGVSTYAQSCITCHTYAATRPATLVPRDALPQTTHDGTAGDFKECYFHGIFPQCPAPQRTSHDLGSRTFIQSSFVWSMIARAQYQAPLPLHHARRAFKKLETSGVSPVRKAGG